MGFRLAITVWMFAQVLGICHDKSADCHAWQQAGQCAENSEYMHYTCPLSCGTCQHNCSDSSEHCVEWMRQGECESNTLFMLRECPVACGVCTPECSDTNGGYEAGPLAVATMCEQWAKDGACEGNPDHMLVHCPVACGVCKPKCKDLNEACSSWGGEGQCESNPKFMLKNCPATCRVCGHSANAYDDAGQVLDEETAKKLHLERHGTEKPEKNDEGHGCQDKQPLDACAGWVASGECDENPGFMLVNCAESCNLCRRVCQDHNASCRSWSQAGECTSNEAFMKKECPASCGVCQALEANRQVKKDEL